MVSGMCAIGQTRVGEEWGEVLHASAAGLGHTLKWRGPGVVLPLAASGALLHTLLDSFTKHIAILQCSVLHYDGRTCDHIMAYAAMMWSAKICCPHAVG